MSSFQYLREAFLPGGGSRVPTIGAPARPWGVFYPSLNEPEGVLDHDELEILASSTELEGTNLRHFLFHVRQTVPGTKDVNEYFKAVRFIRITRVPRHNVQAKTSNDAGTMWPAQVDMLKSVQSSGIPFVQLIFRSASLGHEILFCWGVQGIGATPEDAIAEADRFHYLLTKAIQSGYQQLMTSPLAGLQAAAIAQAQEQWKSLAIARGRPLPSPVGIGKQTFADGNRTDPQNALSQMEGMLNSLIDVDFALLTITVPMAGDGIVDVLERTLKEMTAVTSTINSSRSTALSIGSPFIQATNDGVSSGNAHTATTAHALIQSDNTTDSFAQGQQHGNTIGDTTGAAHQDSTSAGLSDGVSHQNSTALTENTAESNGTGETTSAALAHGASVATADSTGTTQGTGLTQSEGVQHSSSLGSATSLSNSWGQNASQSLTKGETLGNSWNQTGTSTLSTTDGHTGTASATNTDATGQNSSNNTSAGLFGLGTSSTGGNNQTSSLANGLTNAFNQGVTASDAQAAGVGGSAAATSSTGASEGVNQGQSATDSQTATDTVGSTQADALSHNVSASSSATDSVGQTATESAAKSLSSNATSQQGAGLTQGAGDGSTQASSLSNGSASTTSDAKSNMASTSQSATATAAKGTGSGTTASTGDSSTVNTGRSANQGFTGGINPAISLISTQQHVDETAIKKREALAILVDRYSEATTGYFTAQTTLLCPDPTQLSAAMQSLQFGMWGPGTKNHIAQDNFEVRLPINDGECVRLRQHNATFSIYKRLETENLRATKYKHSQFLTITEASALTHPPAIGVPGIEVVQDSIPTYNMKPPAGDAVSMGRLIYGPLGIPSEVRLDFDPWTLGNLLFAGETRSGKTSTMLRLATQLVQIRRKVRIPGATGNPLAAQEVERSGSVLMLDWKTGFRRTISALPYEEIKRRFRIYSINEPELGEFRINPLALPDMSMERNVDAWLGIVSDLFASAFGLSFNSGRSYFYEALSELYSANRLKPFRLAPEYTPKQPRKGDNHAPRQPTVEMLPAIPANEIPANRIKGEGIDRYANVYTCPELSRMISLTDVALYIRARLQIAELSNNGTERDRITPVFRRLEPFLPGRPFAKYVASDPSLEERTSLSARDLLDPDRELVTVIELGDLDHANRHFMVGAIIQSIWAYAKAHGPGAFSQGGAGIGGWIFVDEAHEVIEPESTGEAWATHKSAEMWESLTRMCIDYGLHFSLGSQSPQKLPQGVLGSASTVFVHTLAMQRDREAIYGRFGFMNTIGNEQAEFKHLAALPPGEAIVRLPPQFGGTNRESFPYHLKVDDPGVPGVTTETLLRMLDRGKSI